MADDSEGEERFVTVGQDLLSRILVVVWTLRAPDRIRVISARKAIGRERRQYRDKS